MNDVTFKLKTDEIRQIRRVKDLSQDYMADVLGLSQSQYSRIENGESAVSFDKVMEIAKALNVNFVDIIDCGKGQTFNNYNCSHLNNNIENVENIHNNNFEQERKAYLEQIKYLQEQNAELLKLIKKH
jgi:transcriptional regulator with XRE-family HTH domain